MRARPATTACCPTATSRLHELINRHLVRDLLLQLAQAGGDGAAAGRGPSNRHRARTDQSSSPLAEPARLLERQFAAWLTTHGYRQPDGSGDEAPASARTSIYRAGADGCVDGRLLRRRRPGGRTTMLRRRRLDRHTVSPATQDWQQVVRPLPERLRRAGRSAVTATLRGRHAGVRPRPGVGGAARQSTAPDFLVLRPLGGGDDEVAGVFPALEDGAARRRSRRPTRPTRATGAQRGPAAHRAADRLPLQRGPVPLAGAARRRAPRLPARAAADGAAAGHGAAADRRRRRHRQDHRGRPDRRRAARQGDARGLAVLCRPALAEQWQRELRDKFGIDAELVLPVHDPRLERAARRRVAVRPVPDTSSSPPTSSSGPALREHSGTAARTW